jgi:hypothetical protein
MAFLEHHKIVDMVFSDYITRKSSHATREALGKGVMKEWEPFSRRVPNGLILRGRFCDTISIPLSKIHTNTIMIRKKVFQDIGLFREDLKTSEDTDLWLRVVKYKPEFGYLDEPLANYNRYRSSITRNAPYLHALGRKQYLKLLKEEYKNEEGRRKIFKAINGRLTYVYGDMGYYFYKTGRKVDAVQNFLKSIFFKYNHWMSYKFLVLAVLSGKSGRGKNSVK